MFRRGAGVPFWPTNSATEPGNEVCPMVLFPFRVFRGLCVFFGLFPLLSSSFHVFPPITATFPVTRIATSFSLASNFASDTLCRLIEDDQRIYYRRRRFHWKFLG